MSLKFNYKTGSATKEGNIPKVRYVSKQHAVYPFIYEQVVLNDNKNTYKKAKIISGSTPRPMEHKIYLFTLMDRFLRMNKDYSYNRDEVIKAIAAKFDAGNKTVPEKTIREYVLNAKRVGK